LAACAFFFVDDPELSNQFCATLRSGEFLNAGMTILLLGQRYASLTSGAVKLPNSGCRNLSAG